MSFVRTFSAIVLMGWTVGNVLVAQEATFADAATPTDLGLVAITAMTFFACFTIWRGATR